MIRKDPSCIDCSTLEGMFECVLVTLGDSALRPIVLR